MTKRLGERPFPLWERITPLGKFSCARQLTGGNHSQMFDVLAEQDSKFRKNKQCVIILCGGCEGAQMPNFVFQSTGGHKFSTEIVAEDKCLTVIPVPP